MIDEAEELRRCETYYSKAVAGATSDEEELAIAQDLLEKAQRGLVVNDDASGLIYAQAPDLPVDADFMIETEAAERRARLRQVLLVVGGLIAALVVVLLAYGGGGKQATPTPAATAASQVSLATATLTPTSTLSPTPTLTPTPTPRPTATLTPSPVPAKEVEVKAEPVKLEPDAVVPVSLEIAGRYFPIVATTLRDDAWAYADDPGQASWLAGSYVNVVLGLPYSRDNLDLLQVTLKISDTLTLRNNVAGVNRYRVVDRRLVGVYEIEALGQQRAGLTLVLVGGGDESPDRRLVVWAVAAPGKEADTP